MVWVLNFSKNLDPFLPFGHAGKQWKEENRKADCSMTFPEQMLSPLKIIQKISSPISSKKGFKHRIETLLIARRFSRPTRFFIQIMKMRITCSEIFLKSGSPYRKSKLVVWDECDFIHSKKSEKLQRFCLFDLPGLCCWDLSRWYFSWGKLYNWKELCLPNWRKIFN